ncbi:unnamed protein product, partial [Brenthis ino]
MQSKSRLRPRPPAPGGAADAAEAPTMRKEDLKCNKLSLVYKKSRARPSEAYSEIAGSRTEYRRRTLAHCTRAPPPPPAPDLDMFALIV